MNRHAKVSVEDLHKSSKPAVMSDAPAAADLGRPPQQLSWDEHVKDPTDQFNNSGVPYKSKRLADVSVEALQNSSSPAVQLDAPAPGQPQTLEDLLNNTCCMKVKSHAPAIFCY